MSKRSTLLQASAFALGVGLAGVAHAQSAIPSMTCLTPMRSNPCMYDSRGSFVGIANSYEMVLRVISGKWYWMFADADGFTDNTLFFYASSNCTGQPYVTYKGETPTIAWFDGATTIWGPGPSHAVLSMDSWSLEGAPNPTAAGSCSSYGAAASFPMDSAEAIKIDTSANQFHPPFSVR